MTSTFQCDYCQCFTFKRCDKFKLKCTSHGGMYNRCPLYFSEIYKKALKVQILNEVTFRQVVRKRASFQGRKNENTPKFPSIKI